MELHCTVFPQLAEINTPWPVDVAGRYVLYNER
jgi:hypothetical protein